MVRRPATVGGHYYLPRDDQLPKAPGQLGNWARESRIYSFAHRHHESIHDKVVGTVVMQDGDNGYLAQPEETKPGNRSHDIEPLDTGPTSPRDGSSHFLDGIRRHRVVERGVEERSQQLDADDSACARIWLQCIDLKYWGLTRTSPHPPLYFLRPHRRRTA